MVVGLDLKPLTDETITEMGYPQHDLWLVKIGTIVFGPFETESLKHYVGDNEHLFENSLASRMDHEEFKPFWDHATFQRRKLKAVNVNSHEGPFWLLNNGLKIGPFSFTDIDKKIEVGFLGMTDHISVDDGANWPKIYEIHGFDRRTHSPNELPKAPKGEAFQPSRLELVEKNGMPRSLVTDVLAGMAHSGQVQARVIQFKIEELTLQKKIDTEVSEKTKWIIPTAVAVLLALAMTGNYIFSNNDESPLIAEGETQDQFYRFPGKKRPQQDQANGQDRQPASFNYTKKYHDPERTQESAYPTHVETHEPSYDDMVAADHNEGPVAEVEPPAEEHSLVSASENENANENQSLDAAMNGVEQPVVEEVSDF